MTRQFFAMILLLYSVERYDGYDGYDGKVA